MKLNQLREHPEFWEYVDRLVQESEIVIDRPKDTYRISLVKKGKTRKLTNWIK